MKIQIASDLHLEISEHRFDLKRSPIKAIGDVLILAGDIHNLNYDEDGEITEFFDEWKKNFKKVICIPGNHEYYHNSVTEDNTFFYKEEDNLIKLSNHTYEYEGVKFICSSLWSGISWESSTMLNDYRATSNFTWKDENILHKRCTEFLEKELNEPYDGKKVVITHHLPSYKCISEKYKNVSCNDGFAAKDCDHLFVEGVGPELWIHGHSHDFKDIMIEKTRVVRNPRGFFHELKDFRTDFVVEV